jgi:hypothetical protein
MEIIPGPVKKDFLDDVVRAGDELPFDPLLLRSATKQQVIARTGSGSGNTSRRCGAALPP